MNPKNPQSKTPWVEAELRALRRFMLRHPPANNQRAVALFLSLGHHEALVGSRASEAA